MAKLIAVVDDDESFVTFMQMLLEEEQGYAVLLLHDESTAYERVHAAQPDAIIMDMRLEHPDGGWRLLQAVRRDPLLAPIPVIISTADNHAIQEHADDLRRLHCEVLPKPFLIEELLTLVERLIGPAKPGDPPGAATAAVAPH